VSRARTGGRRVGRGQRAGRRPPAAHREPERRAPGTKVLVQAIGPPEWSVRYTEDA